MYGLALERMALLPIYYYVQLKKLIVLALLKICSNNNIHLFCI